MDFTPTHQTLGHYLLDALQTRIIAEIRLIMDLLAMLLHQHRQRDSVLTALTLALNQLLLLLKILALR